MILLAEASNEFYGQWVIVALGIIGGLGGLAAIASYFATRRDMENVERRVSTIETEMKADRHNNQIHASERSRTLFAEIKATNDNLDLKIDQTREKLEKRINRISLGVARLCERVGARMPGEEDEI